MSVGEVGVSGTCAETLVPFSLCEEENREKLLMSGCSEQCVFSGVSARTTRTPQSERALSPTVASYTGFNQYRQKGDTSQFVFGGIAIVIGYLIEKILIPRP